MSRSFGSATDGECVRECVELAPCGAELASMRNRGGLIDFRWFGEDTQEVSGGYREGLARGNGGSNFLSTSGRSSVGERDAPKRQD